MSFLDRFVKLPIIALEEVAEDSVEFQTGEIREYHTWEMVTPFDISSYGPSSRYIDTSGENNTVNIYLKNGRLLEVNMTLSEFEAKMNLKMQ